eukprot:CAMPEP_0197421922 /NCGR_PEP_ID=MMETSP1170-20131217/12121_1 /TAXON_ID=54406 /ORGANISM="Sarcinochrysis sp, Strain CCMP770" /LENGTH=206 /DNA_ID=CAMNT_0042949213 /DNA_START=57 /DNA_END=677 /DNA_ORIENTATION=-
MIETEKATTTATSSALFNLAHTALTSPGTRTTTTTTTNNMTPGAAAPAPAATLQQQQDQEISRILRQADEDADAPANGAAKAPPPPPALMSRQSSLTRLGSTSTGQRDYEWRRFLTVEERQGVRAKIRQAYKNACTSYDDLLTTCVAIEEELLHISAPSRLDYFKSGCQFDKRVAEKRKQFSSTADDAAEAKRLKVDQGDTTKPAA